MKAKSPPESSLLNSPVWLLRTSMRLEGAVAAGGHDLRPRKHRDVRPGSELVDQIARHALLEAVAAAEDGHALCVVGEEDRRLARGVAGPDDLDVEAMGVRRLAPAAAVGDALARQPVEALDREPPPGHAAGKDDRPSSQNVAAVQMHLPGSRVDPLDRASHKDLGAEPARLLQCPTRQLVAGDTRREAKVVLDSRRRAGLPPRRLSLDRDRPQALRRAVDGRGQARRSGTDNHRVVLGRPCLGAKPEQLGQPAEPVAGSTVVPSTNANDRVRPPPAGMPVRPTGRPAPGASGS